VGLGIVGSAIAWYLAKAGYQVVGYDQFAPPHSRGSSHGQNRLLRRTPAEGMLYAQLAERAFALWPAVEKSARRKLVHSIGCLDISEPGSNWAAISHDLACTLDVSSRELTLDEARGILPIFRFRKGMTVTHSPLSGTVAAEGSIEAFLELACDAGAKLYKGVKVEYVDTESCAVLARGTALRRYDHVLLCCGGWIRQFVQIPVSIEKRVLAWFTHAEQNRTLPGFVVDGPRGTVYGMPGSDGISYKIGDDKHLGQSIRPNAPLTVSNSDRQFLLQRAGQYLKGVKKDAVIYKACKYTLTSSKDFLIDRIPENPRIVVFSPCSGHGFKYAPAYGEIAKAFIENSERRLPFDLSLFRA